MAFQIIMDCCATWPSASFNGLEFSGLTFDIGTRVNGFLLGTDIPGLDRSRVTFGASFIEINLEGLSTIDQAPESNYVTLQVTTPEPSTLVLLAAGLVGLTGLVRRKRFA